MRGYDTIIADARRTAERTTREQYVTRLRHMDISYRAHRNNVFYPLFAGALQAEIRWLTREEA